MLADLVLAVSGFFDVKWAIEGRSYCGGLCSVQGALVTIGCASTSLFTTAIAVHTWISIYRSQRTKYSLMVWLLVSLSIWAFVFLFSLLGWVAHHENSSPFYAPTPFCKWHLVLRDWMLFMVSSPHQGAGLAPTIQVLALAAHICG